MAVGISWKSGKIPFWNVKKVTDKYESRLGIVQLDYAAQKLLYKIFEILIIFREGYCNRS